MGRRILAAILLLTVVVSLAPGSFSASATQGSPMVTLASVRAERGQTVAVTVSVAGNPGIWGMDLEISYDRSALTLVSVENGDLFADEEWTPGDLTGDVYILSYEASGFTDVVTPDATLATLYFEVDDGAVFADYEIRASFDMGDIINVAFEDICFEIGNGTVSVFCGHRDLTEMPYSGPGCTVDGNEQYFICDDCGIVLKADKVTQTTAADETIPALGHDWSEKLQTPAYIKDSGADCKERDIYWYDCARCDEISTTEYYVGTTAGPHDLIHHEPVDADHTKPGNIEYWTCDGCGKYFRDPSAQEQIGQVDTVIPQIPHSHGTAWENDDAQHWNECACGDKINIYDHEYDDTCDTDCNVCGHIRTISHTWAGALSWDGAEHWTECSVCGVKDGLEGHHGGAADCQDQALCVDCGQPYGELTGCDFAAKRGEAAYLKSEATCLAAAVYYKSCTVCGKVGSDTFTDGPLGGHRLDEVEAEPATHEDSGNIAHYICQICGQLFADDGATQPLAPEDVAIPKEGHSYAVGYDEQTHWMECDCGSKIGTDGHSFGQWVTTQEPGDGADGSKERICYGCSYRQVERIPAEEIPVTGDEHQLVLLFTVFFFSVCVGAGCFWLSIRKKGKYQR